MQGMGFRVEGVWCKVWGSGFRVHGECFGGLLVGVYGVGQHRAARGRARV